MLTQQHRRLCIVPGECAQIFYRANAHRFLCAEELHPFLVGRTRPAQVTSRQEGQAQIKLCRSIFLPRQDMFVLLYRLVIIPALIRQPTQIYTRRRIAAITLQRMAVGLGGQVACAQCLQIDTRAHVVAAGNRPPITVHKMHIGGQRLFVLICI